MNEKQFIEAMIADGWQALALNDSGDVVKNPRKAARQWWNSRTGETFNGDTTHIFNQWEMIDCMWFKGEYKTWEILAKLDRTASAIPVHSRYFNILIGK